MSLINDWIKKQMRAIAFATASVEKEALNQTSEEIKAGSGHHQRVNHGSLMDNLQKGEITLEVEELRWRLYKVLKASKGRTAKLLGYDADDMPIVDYGIPNSVKKLLKKVPIDSYDDYPLEMVINNNSITMGWLDSLDNSATSEFEIADMTKEVTDDKISAIIGNVKNDDYHSYIKSEKPIKINRDLRPKFEIEKYATKLNVRSINDREKLLEFYISQYPDQYNKKTRLLISEIKRAIKNHKFSDMLEIKNVNFITYNVLGANDFQEYNYRILGFDKIVEYDGNYIIKFKSEVTINGEYLLEKYRMTELDERYSNKEAKK